MTADVARALFGQAIGQADAHDGEHGPQGDPDRHEWADCPDAGKIQKHAGERKAQQVEVHDVEQLAPVAGRLERGANGDDRRRREQAERGQPGGDRRERARQAEPRCVAIAEPDRKAGGDRADENGEQQCGGYQGDKQRETTSWHCDASSYSQRRGHRARRARSNAPYRQAECSENLFR